MSEQQPLCRRCGRKPAWREGPYCGPCANHLLYEQRKAAHAQAKNEQRECPWKHRGER